VTEFQRYAPAMALFLAGSAIMAAIFGYSVLAYGSDVTPEIYGSAVYEIPALAWVTVQLTSGMIASLGCWFDRPQVAAIGASGTAALILFFAVSSIGTPHGTILTAGALGWNGPLATLCAFVAWRGVKNER